MLNKSKVLAGMPALLYFCTLSKINMIGLLYILTQGQNFTPVFMAYFCQFYEERALQKVL